MEYVNLGSRIRKARKNKNHSKYELAEKLGVQVKTIKRWETDSSVPRVNRLNMMAGTLDVPLLWLLAGSDEIPSSTSGSGLEAIKTKTELANGLLKELSVLISEIEILTKEVND